MKKVPLLQQLISKNPGIAEKELYARILCGEVMVGEEKIRDPEHRVSIDAAVRFDQKRFVSRGGKKLDFALNQWGTDVSGKVFVDAGCSTGGFSQVLLEHGASHVHAVDVGYNQIDYSLRIRPEISVHERTNIMELTSLTPSPDAAVVDISFRSAVPVTRNLMPLLKEEWLIALIKPQFEWKNPDKNFDGIVRSTKIHIEILDRVIRSLWNSGVYPAAILESPIPGRKGNREFFFEIRKAALCTMESIIEAAVKIIER